MRVPRLSFSLATLLCISILVAASAACAAGDRTCGPFFARNQAARAALRGSKPDIPTATRIVQEVLTAKVNGKTNNDDFGANFNHDMILMATAGNSHQAYLAGVHSLENTAKLLEAQIAQAGNDECAVAGDYYRIYNTIGAEYFNDGNIGKAGKFYAVSFKFVDKLKPDSKASFFGNLGQFAYYLTEYGCALQAYQNAADLDTNPAEKKRDLGNAKKMSDILGARNGRVKCGAREFFPPLLKEARLYGQRVVDLGAGRGRNDQTFVGCEIDAESPEVTVELGYSDRSRTFNPLIEVKKTLHYTCGKFAFNVRSGHVAARVKNGSYHPVTVQLFQLAETSVGGI